MDYFQEVIIQNREYKLKENNYKENTQITGSYFGGIARAQSIFLLLVTDNLLQGQLRSLHEVLFESY